MTWTSPGLTAASLPHFPQGLVLSPTWEFSTRTVCPQPLFPHVHRGPWEQHLPEDRAGTPAPSTRPTLGGPRRHFIEGRLDAGAGAGSEEPLSQRGACPRPGPPPSPGLVPKGVVATVAPPRPLRWARWPPQGHWASTRGSRWAARPGSVRRGRRSAGRGRAADGLRQRWRGAGWPRAWRGLLTQGSGQGGLKLGACWPVTSGRLSIHLGPHGPAQGPSRPHGPRQ